VYGFMAQFGIHGDPALNSVWREATIPDDPVQQSNKRGYVTFATAGPNTRTTQVSINFADKNTTLDGQGFAPFGKVVEGMEVVNQLFSGYGEAAPKGHGPDQNRIQKEGNTYLTKSFPKLDSIKKASIEPAGP
jgi:peptidyl-prolyl cis-trans isomerase A (cyclophilin A)